MITNSDGLCAAHARQGIPGRRSQVPSPGRIAKGVMEVLAAVRRGDIDPQTGNCYFNGSRVLILCSAEERARRELDELEDRIRALEQASANRSGRSRTWG